MSVVVPFDRGGSSSTPPNWPILASLPSPTHLQALVASGAYADVAIDTVSLKLPWPLEDTQLNDGGMVAHDAEGVIQWESQRRLSLKNSGPSWSASISCRTRGSELEVSGSPVKFMTGQNLHQPVEDLIWLLERFLPRLQSLLEERFEVRLGDNWVQDCLDQGKVTRLDLNRQFDHGSDRRAKDWLATAVAARNGIKLGGKVYPYRAFSEGSVRAGPKRRWHMAVYMKRPEMGVKGHMTRGDIKDALLNEAEGITRHELRTMSEGFSKEQRSVRHWNRAHLELHFASFWEHLYEPGVEVVERRRTQRRVRRRKPSARLDYDLAMDHAHEAFVERYGVTAAPGTVDMAVIQSTARDVIERSAVARYVERYEWVETEERGMESLRAVERDILEQYRSGIHVYERLISTKADRTLRRIVNNIREGAGIDITVAPVVSGKLVPLRLARPTIWQASRSFDSLCELRRVS